MRARSAGPGGHRGRVRPHKDCYSFASRRGTAIFRAYLVGRPGRESRVGMALGLTCLTQVLGGTEATWLMWGPQSARKPQRLPGLLWRDPGALLARCPGPSTILGIGETLRERPLRRLSSKAQSGHFKLFNARAYTLLGRKHRPVKLQDHYMWLEMNFEN